MTRAAHRETEVAGVEFREVFVGNRFAARFLQVGIELLDDGVLFLHDAGELLQSGVAVGGLAGFSAGFSSDLSGAC